MLGPPLFIYHLRIHGAFIFQDGEIQKGVDIIAQKFFETLRLFFVIDPIDSMYFPQVPIATKSACQKNIEENEHSFDPNIVCAGRNGKGTCQVIKGTLLLTFVFLLQESNLHEALPHQFVRFYQQQKKKIKRHRCK